MTMLLSQVGLNLTTFGQTTAFCAVQSRVMRQVLHIFLTISRLVWPKKGTLAFFFLGDFDQGGCLLPMLVEGDCQLSRRRSQPQLPSGSQMMPLVSSP